MKHKGLKQGIVAFLVSLSLVFFILVFYPLYQLFYQPMLVRGHQPVILQMDKSTTATSLVSSLYEKQFIQSKRLLLFFIRTQGLSHQLKAGIYQVKPGESAMMFVHRVAEGDVMKVAFRINEGMNQDQVVTLLEKAPFLNSTVTNWEEIASPHTSAEGLLLADTYYYHAGSQSDSILMLARKNLDKTLLTSWQGRAAALPYKDPYELLIVASILEKEASLPMEKRLISGVILNRLHAHMPLQMDPTVIYALGKQYHGKLSKEDLKVDSPYNTYRYRGLPPTPIAMVGREALDAAAHPMMSNYLYFVAKGDGSHHFSTNYDEQRQAIMRYQNKQ